MKFNSIAQSSLVVLSLSLSAVHSFAAAAPPAPYCVAVNGGFGGGGTTFVARSFSLPEASKCTPWSGYTKTASTVILTTSGTSCLSTDSKALTVSVTSADPWFLGAGQIAADYIQLVRGSATDPFTGHGLRLLRWKRRTGDLHQRSVDPAVVARLTGHNTRAATFQGILRWERQADTLALWKCTRHANAFSLVAVPECVGDR